jgi:hypothetical protein
LTEQGFGQGRPDDATRARNVPPGQPQYGAGPGQGEAHPGQGAAYPGQGAAYPGQGAAYPGQGAAGYPPPSQQLSSAKGFVSSLFDFGFTSFVAPKVIKVLYVLIMIVLGLGALGIVLEAFLVRAVLGIFALVIVAPLYFFILLALYRIVLELFMVIFRIAEDVRTIRDRGGLR